MGEATWEVIANFLTGYRRVLDEQTEAEAAAISEFQAEFERLKGEYEHIKHNAQVEGRLRAPEFNIFNILGLERYEEHTHSAFIAHLLNPNGSHGQGFLFLQAFLAYFTDKFDDFPIPSEELEMGHWEVITELRAGKFGRLDIVVRSPDLNYLCAIENKIDAWEQSKQLKRYSQWLDLQSKRYTRQALIYLTPSHQVAYSAEGVTYYPITYHTDVAGWLDLTLGEIEAPGVREVVKQYRDLARVL